MTNKRFLVGMLALIFGMVVMGCTAEDYTVSEAITGIIGFIGDNMLTIIIIIFVFIEILKIKTLLDDQKKLLDDQRLLLNNQKLLLDDQSLLLNNQKLLLDEQNLTLIRMLNKIETITRKIL